MSGLLRRRDNGKIPVTSVQYWLAIVRLFASPESHMDNQNRSDIAAFPELFAGMEQFIAEEAAGFKRTSVILAAIALPAGMLLAWLLNRGF